MEDSPAFTFLSEATDEQLAGYLAAQTRRARKKLSLTQPQFAAKAGISLRTYKRFERDGSASLGTFVKVIAALDRKIALSLLFPGQVPTPKPTLQEQVMAAREAQKKKIEGR